MDVITLASLAALVVKVTTVIKAAGKDWNVVATQAVTWAVAVAVLFLAAAADLTAGLVIYDGAPALGELDGASLFLASLAFGSLGSVAYDTRKALDSTDSAAEPRLLKDNSPA